MLGERLNRLPEALEATDRLLAEYPDHSIGRGGRAVYLARLGRVDEAVAEVRKLLTGDPEPSVYYHAGCVLALAAKADPKYRDEAIGLVSKALLKGYGHDFLIGDPDLDALDGDGRFRTIADGVRR